MSTGRTSSISLLSAEAYIEAIPEDAWTPIPYWMDGAADVAETTCRACLRSSTKGFDLARSKRYTGSTASLIVVYRSALRYYYACRRTILPQTGAQRLLRQALHPLPGRGGRRAGTAHRSEGEAHARFPTGPLRQLQLSWLHHRPGRGYPGTGGRPSPPRRDRECHPRPEARRRPQPSPLWLRRQRSPLPLPCRSLAHGG